MAELHLFKWMQLYDYIRLTPDIGGADGGQIGLTNCVNSTGLETRTSAKSFLKFWLLKLG